MCLMGQPYLKGGEHTFPRLEWRGATESKETSGAGRQPPAVTATRQLTHPVRGWHPLRPACPCSARSRSLAGWAAGRAGAQHRQRQQRGWAHGQSAKSTGDD